jgi:regulatory protein
MTDEAKARESAIRYLARRDHSASEIRRKLIQKGFSQQIAESTIESLLEKGYLNDRRYAERWASAAVEGGRCYGPRLRAELRQRGVDPETVSEVIAELTGDRDESQDLRILVKRRYPEFNPLTADERDKRRIFNFLQRRGFSSGLIFAVFRGIPFEE